MFKQVRMHDAILKFYQRSQPIAFSNAETLYDDLVLLRDQILMYGDLSEAQTDYLNNFIDTFDSELTSTTQGILSKWIGDGLLAELIRVAINDEVVDSRDGESKLNLRLDRDKQDSENKINLLQDGQSELSLRLIQDKQDNETKINLLKEKDNQLTEQLIEKVTHIELDALLATLLDGGPSIFMDTLAMLQSTYPNGASGVALVRETDPAKIYVWDGSQWKDYGDYQGVEVKDGTVSIEKLDPSLTYDVNINLLNPEEIDKNSYGFYHFSNGEFVAGSFYSTPLIPVKPNTIYTKEAPPLTGNQITFWDVNGNYLSGIDIGKHTDKRRFVTPNSNNVRFVRYPMSGANLDDQMFVEGFKLPNKKIAFGERALLVETDIKTLKTRTVNLVDKNAISTLGYFSWMGDFNYVGSFKSTDLIPVDENGWYSKSIASNITFYDENNNFVDGYDSGTLFKVPANKGIKYMRSSIPTSVNDFMIVKGFVLPNRYIDYGDLSIELVSLGDIKDIKTVVESEQYRNVLVLENIETGYYHNYQSGVVSRGRTVATTGSINVVQGEVFTRSKESVGFNHVTFWDSLDNYVEGLDLGNSRTILVPNNPNIKTMKLALPLNAIDGNLMLLRGTDYPSYKYILDDQFKIPSQEKIEDNNFIKPFRKVTNPIITKEIVTDRSSVTGVADPFIVMDGGRYHIFFEVLGGVDVPTDPPRDEIGHAYSDNLLEWTYTQIVLSFSEHGHRSAYPHVFKIDGEWYMLPDVNGNVKLYKATSFPLEWELVGDLILGQFSDTNIFKIKDVWYMTTFGGALGRTGTSLYYNTSGDFKNDQWEPHPVGLVIPNASGETWTRPAGTPKVFDDYVLLPIQVTRSGVYGERAYLYKLGNFSTTTCRATNLGILVGSGMDGDWTSKSMHHVSYSDYISGEIYAVDGQFSDGEYAIGLFEDI